MLARHGSNTKLRDENFELDSETLALLCRSHFVALQQSRAAKGTNPHQDVSDPCSDETSGVES